MEEIWKDIRNYEGRYKISNLGKVKSVTSNIILKPFEDTRGYLKVNLWDMHKYTTYRIHRLVAETFIPNLDNLPQVNHKDENKKNNSIDNLEWCSNKYNAHYSRTWRKLERKVKMINPISKNIIKIYPSISEAYRDTKIVHISDCCRNKRAIAGGYIWEYA